MSSGTASDTHPPQAHTVPETGKATTGEGTGRPELNEPEAGA
ncbi:hypothetical protein ACFU9X_29180 [Streptomyces atratus]